MVRVVRGDGVREGWWGKACKRDRQQDELASLFAQYLALLMETIILTYNATE